MSPACVERGLEAPSRDGGDDLIGHLDRFDTEEHFVDYDETGPFSVSVGDSECM